MTNETYKLIGIILLTNKDDENIDNVLKIIEDIGLNCFIDIENNIQFNSDYPIPSLESVLRTIIEETGGGVLDYVEGYGKNGEIHNCNLEIKV